MSGWGTLIIQDSGEEESLLLGELSSLGNVRGLQ